MDAKTAAYVAGIMDGEGSFYIEKARRKHGFRYRIVVSLLMCDAPTMTFVGRATGKRPWKKPLRTLNVITRRGFAFVLTWRNGPAEELLRTILPYLHGKRHQALLCIRFQDRVAKPLGIKFTEKDFVVCERLKLKVQALNNGTARC
jgi:hypothetical protein